MNHAGLLGVSEVRILVIDICRPVFIGNLLVRFLFMGIWLLDFEFAGMSTQTPHVGLCIFASFDLSPLSYIGSTGDVSFGAFRLPTILNSTIINLGHTLCLQGL